MRGVARPSIDHIGMKPRRELANLGEVEAHIHAAAKLLDRTDREEVQLSITQAKGSLAEAERWVNDAFVCVRVDHDIPDELTFRRIGAGNKKDDFEPVWR